MTMELDMVTRAIEQFAEKLRRLEAATNFIFIKPWRTVSFLTMLPNGDNLLNAEFNWPHLTFTLVSANWSSKHGE